jgi:autotransporter family porin
VEFSERNTLYIQPKAQITWMGVEADSHKEANGTHVEGSGDGNVQTRISVRIFGKGHNKLDDGKGRTFQPFTEVSWIHNTKEFGASLNGNNVNLAGTRNIGELKAGVEGQLTKNIALWGNVGQQVGDKSYSDTSAMLGVKASF